jgi:PadR family transcriptional regulator PadR
MEGGNVDSTQLLKGVLDVAVLAVIEHEDGYGYDIVRRLKQGGLEDVGDASVYGTLRRLFTAGALNSYVVASEDGPHRKYYGINETGSKMLAEQRKSWLAFSSNMTALLSSGNRNSPRNIGGN